MSNIGYLILLLSYAINVGIFYAISTLLSQILEKHYEASVTLQRILMDWKKNLIIIHHHTFCHMQRKYNEILYYYYYF